MGDFMGVSDTNVKPTPFYAGNETFVVSDGNTLAGFLSACRNGLERLGLDYTDFDVLWKVSRTDDTAALGIRWRNMDRFSREITQLEGTYYCKNTCFGWRVVLVEFGQSINAIISDRQKLVIDGLGDQECVNKDVIDLHTFQGVRDENC